MFTKFILSLAISHEFLDIYMLYPNFRVLIYYFFSIHTINTFFYASKVPYILFILLSMFHFGKDFYYISGENNDFDIWGGVYIISCTFFKDDLRDWNWFFKKTQIDVELSHEIINTMEISYLTSSIAILCYGSNFTVFFCILYTVLVSNYHSSFNSIIGYFCSLHTPIAVYKFYIDFGKDAIVIWIIFGLFLNKFGLCQCTTKESINGLLSFTIVHMLLISNWEREIGQN